MIVKKRKKNSFCEFISINILFRLKPNPLWRVFYVKFLLFCLFLRLLQRVVNFLSRCFCTCMIVYFKCSFCGWIKREQLSSTNRICPEESENFREKVLCVKIHCRNRAEGFCSHQLPSP